MRPRLLALFTLFLLLVSFTLSALAQSETSSADCQYLFLRYSGNGTRLALIHSRTLEEFTVLEGAPRDIVRFDTSPDCRYVAATLDDACPRVVVWETTSGSRIWTPEIGCTYRSGWFYWKPDGSALLVTSYNEATLWFPDSNTALPLNAPPQYSYFDSLINWDDLHGWVWFQSYTGTEGVSAFDMQTGNHVLTFTNASIDETRRRRGTPSVIRFSPDGTKVIVFGQRDEFLHQLPAMTVYDIASGIGTQVQVEQNAAGHVVLSPDNRYLVMGYTALRVWDMQNLPENVEARLPTLRIGTGGDRIRGLQFVDNTTIRVTTIEGDSLWNVVTGEQVG